MVVLSAFSLLPDVDFLLHALSPSVDSLEHRGATHSLVFALAIGLFVAVALRVSARPRPIHWGVVTMLVVASHPLLDAFGHTTLGVELLWPFSDARFLAPLDVLPNPGPQDLLLRRGLADLGLEFLIFLPFWVYAFFPRRARSATADPHDD